MKALKKTFSVILCLCMIMSVMAAGLNAFAQEEATAALDGAVSEAAALAVSDPTDEKPDVDAMERTKVKYPIGASKKAVNRSIGRVEDILFTILKVPEGGVPQVLNEKVYTNETVALVAKKLFPLVGGLNSLVAKGPKDLAAKLDKETCAGAIAALNAAAATLGADGKPVDKLEAWHISLLLTATSVSLTATRRASSTLLRRCSDPFRCSLPLFHLRTQPAYFTVRSWAYTRISSPYLRLSA